LQNLTFGLRPKTWSKDSEGYASDAVDLGSSSGKGCCSVSDGLERLHVVRSMNLNRYIDIPKDYLPVRMRCEKQIALIAYLSVTPHEAL
jgi:hypothetical protein